MPPTVRMESALELLFVTSPAPLSEPTAWLTPHMSNVAPLAIASGVAAGRMLLAEFAPADDELKVKSLKVCVQGLPPQPPEKPRYIALLPATVARLPMAYEAVNEALVTVSTISVVSKFEPS